MELEVIAKIENGFKSKFGIPRQSGLIGVESKVVFEPGFRSPEAIRGIEQFSHIWLIWEFSEGFAGGSRDFSPTVRPPRLGGNKRVGVFASRSPNRPNKIAISAVKLERVEKTRRGPVLIVTGADMMNGTPIFDIKPYISYSDSIPGAICGYADEHQSDALKVEFSEEYSKDIPKGLKNTIIKILSGDPRPQYQNDPKREYSFDFDNYAVSFKVKDGVCYVTKAELKDTERK